MMHHHASSCIMHHASCITRDHASWHHASCIHFFHASCLIEIDHASIKCKDASQPASHIVDKKKVNISKLASNQGPIMFHLITACRRQVTTTVISKMTAPTSRNGIVHHLIGASSYHAGSPVQGLDEFFDIKKPNEVVTTGRGWTVADVRRKSFDDIHKLWYVLYKECNLLLSEREKNRRNQRPVLAVEEHRYIKVKRSMAAIKQVLSERQRINDTLRKQGLSATKKDDTQSQS